MVGGVVVGGGVVGGVVVAGGAARRMGGVDKAALEVGGIRLLDRVLAAARPVCDHLVVVGPPRPTTVAGVTFLSEDAPGGGPVPAVAAARSLLAACDPVLVLATDLPLLRSDHLHTLLAALDRDPPPDAAAALDHVGPNPLLATYRSTALDRSLAGLGPGAPAARLLPDAAVAVDLGAATLNVNAPDDLAAAELLASLDPGVADTTHWLREVVLAAAPGALEAIELEHGFDYRHPGGRPFCSIRPGTAEVALVLPATHGATPVRVGAPGDPSAAALARLIQAAGSSGKAGPPG